MAKATRLASALLPLPGPWRRFADPRLSRVYLFSLLLLDWVSGGLQDIIFLLHHIVTFSFLRQTITLYILRPFAKSLGIRGPKVLRFQEQGYSFLYWGFMGVLGLVRFPLSSPPDLRGSS
jgi:hypothetical protein